MGLRSRATDSFSDSLNIPRSQPSQLCSPTLISLIPSLTSWAVGVVLESTRPRSPHGVLREDAGVPQLWEGQWRDI